MLSEKRKYKEFIDICKLLNSQLKIIPVLFGSLGLEILSGEEFNSDDIDVLVPKLYLDENWIDLKKLVEAGGYIFQDIHEHEFKRNNIKLAFANEESLIDFADVNHNNLRIVDDEAAKYKLLDYEEYLNVYKMSYKDSYRRDKNNGKDKYKIEYLLNIILNKANRVKGDI